jgi:hypothetical protein
MKTNLLKFKIKSLLNKGGPVPLKDISKVIDMDKSKLSGYLEAMVDYGDLSFKKIGPSNVYSLKSRRNK